MSALALLIIFAVAGIQWLRNKHKARSEGISSKPSKAVIVVASIVAVAVLAHLLGLLGVWRGFP